MVVLDSNSSYSVDGLLLMMMAMDQTDKKHMIYERPMLFYCGSHFTDATLAVAPCKCDHPATAVDTSHHTHDNDHCVSLNLTEKLN